jgi:hypothetical protein
MSNQFRCQSFRISLLKLCMVHNASEKGKIWSHQPCGAPTTTSFDRIPQGTSSGFLMTWVCNSQAWTSEYFFGMRDSSVTDPLFGDRSDRKGFASLGVSARFAVLRRITCSRSACFVLCQVHSIQGSSAPSSKPMIPASTSFISGRIPTSPAPKPSQ